MKAFFAPDAKEKLSGAVTELEGGTAAEVVVSVRARSATYRDVDFLTGFGFALVALVVLLFDPLELDERLFPLEVALAFLIGSAVSANVLAPLVLPEKRRRDEVDRAAKAAFVDQKIGATTRRCGLFVYCSGLEGMVKLVLDVGLPEEKLAKELEVARSSLESALRRDDVGAFVAALQALGKALARELPRREDDVNELADEVT